MMKTRLSIRFLAIRIASILFASFYLFMIVLRVENNSIYVWAEFSRLIIPPLLYLIGFSAIAGWTLTLPNIQFDDNSLFIKRFRRKTMIIPLEKIFLLASTSPFIVPTPVLTYSIHYKNESGHILKVKFWHHSQLFFMLNNSLFQFIESVRRKNPSFIQQTE